MRKQVGRGGMVLVLVSWGLAWGWSELNRPEPLSEPEWEVSSLREFLEAIPSKERKPFRLSRPARKTRASRAQAQSFDPLELNAADSAALEALPFIGPTLARRIIRFRAALGGFIQVSQLQEVYGVDSLAFAVVSKRVEVDAHRVRPLCADTASWSDLRRHPYIGVQGARAIERYRDAHALTRLDELASHPPIGDSLFARWEPYLRCCTCSE